MTTPLPRTVDYAGQKLFHAGDICEATGFDDPTGAIRQFCRKPLAVIQEEPGSATLMAPVPQPPDAEILISISDVVRLVIHSKNPEAEAYLDYIEEELSFIEAPRIASLFQPA